MEQDDLITVSNQLIQEETTLRQSSAYNIPDYGYDNNNLYLGQSDSTYSAALSPYRCTINRIQNAVISNAAVQTADIPHPKFKPVETGERPAYYLDPQVIQQASHLPEMVALVSGIPPEFYTPDANGVTPPLTDEMAQQIKQMVSQSQQAYRQASLLAMQARVPNTAPPPIPKNIYVEINDALEANAQQEAFDILWEEANVDFYFAENQLYTGINGFQFLLYEWNDDTRVSVFNPDLTCVHVDYTRTDITKCQWAIYDFLMSADEAKARFPKFEDEIDQNSTTSPTIPGVSTTLPWWFGNMNFSREMVIVRTMWRRFQPIPLTGTAAMEAGHVVPGQPDEPEQPGVLARIGGGIKKMLGMGESDGQEEAAEGGAPPPSVLRSAKTNAIVGQLTEHGPIPNTTHPDWPVRRGIQQSQMIVGGGGGVVINIKECEFWDIPLCHNVNIPIQQTPWGQGEPSRLKGLQVALNNMLSDVVAQQRNNAFPIQVMIRSAYETLKKEAKGFYIKPANLLVVDDDIAKTIGGLDKLVAMLNPNPVSEATVKAVQMLMDLLDRESNESEALQGNAPAGRSGAAIETLQSAARGVIQFKGKRLKMAMLHLARLMRSDMVNRMTPQQLHDLCPKYPIQVWMKLRERWLRNTPDLSIEINSGDAMARQSKQDAIELSQAGIMPIPVAQEKVGGDPEEWQRKNIEYQQQLEAAKMQQPVAPEAAVAPGANESPQQVTA